MLKWAWSMLVLKICFLFSLLTTYQNVKGKSSCSCSAFPLPAFMSAQFVFRSLRRPGLLQRLPSQGCHLELGCSVHSTWQLMFPAAQPTSPFPGSHKWELPSLLTTLICLCQKNPAILHRAILISVIFTYFETGWISGIPPVTYGTRSPAEEACQTLGAADLAFRQLVLFRKTCLLWAWRSLCTASLSLTELGKLKHGLCPSSVPVWYPLWLGQFSSCFLASILPLLFP